MNSLGRPALHSHINFTEVPVEAMLTNLPEGRLVATLQAGVCTATQPL